MRFVERDKIFPFRKHKAVKQNKRQPRERVGPNLKPKRKKMTDEEWNGFYKRCFEMSRKAFFILIGNSGYWASEVDIDDIACEVAIRVSQNDVSNGLLFWMAKNVIRDMRRYRFGRDCKGVDTIKRKFISLDKFESTEILDSVVAYHETGFDVTDNKDYVKMLLKHLDAYSRTLIELYYYQGKDIQQIAEMLKSYSLKVSQGLKSAIRTMRDIAGKDFD